jgi:hypothetical protein
MTLSAGTVNNALLTARTRGTETPLNSMQNASLITAYIQKMGEEFQKS